MTTDTLVERTRAALAGRSRRIVPPGPLIRAAVLVPIVDRGEPRLVFAQRSDRVGHHKGQISFPGGVIDRTDGSPCDAALRECEEEVALPRDAVDVLASLDGTETFATQFVITAFVGRVTWPVEWRPDGEEIERERDGVMRPVHFFDWGSDTIWGATARILTRYLDLVR